MHKPKLRVGLLLDDFTVAAWSYEMLRRIVVNDSAEIVLLAIVVAPARIPTGVDSLATDQQTSRHRIGAYVARAFELLYERLVDRNPSLAPADKRTDVRPLLGNVPHLELIPERRRWSDWFGYEELEQIRAFDLDVMIRLGSRILRGPLLATPRYGVWSYHHGDNRVNRGGPAAFWECYREWPETGTVLQILSEDLDNGKVIYRSSTCTRTESLADNRSAVFWKSAAFLPRMLQRLHSFGAEAFFAELEAESRDPDFYSSPLYRQPRTGDRVEFLRRKIATKIRNRLRWHLYQDQWQLMFYFGDDTRPSLWRFRRIVPPSDRFWADPHVVYVGGRYFIFFEEFVNSRGVGRIAMIEMQPDGTHSNPVIVLERPYHLSYPFVFEHDGDWYMVPETSQNDSIELYRATNFPSGWEYVRTLMSGIKAYDSTLLFRGGKWWLFANVVDVPGASSWDELHLFHSPQLLSSDWVPHPRNPIISDCKQSRPAGRIFEQDGRLYRPSQDCSRRYGYGFNLARIDTLDESRYSEVIVTRVTPNWANDLVATHSYSRAGDLHVIDAQVRRSRFS